MKLDKYRFPKCLDEEKRIVGLPIDEAIVVIGIFLVSFYMGMTVVGIPAKPVQEELADADHFAAYGTPTIDMPDKEEILVAQLLSEVSLLRRRIDELENNDSGENYEAPKNIENENNIADV